MIIMTINYPYAFLDNGDRVHVDRIKGSPRNGSIVDYDGENYKVVANNVDESCSSGICDFQPGK